MFTLRRDWNFAVPIKMLPGKDDSLKFASLSTCDFVPQIAVMPTGFWEARVHIPKIP